MLATVPADIRVFIHAAGAMALVATLTLAVFALANAHRRGDEDAVRFAYRVLVRAVLPAYIVMRVGAQMVLSYEHLDKVKAAWLDIGFITSDAGALLLLITIAISGRRLKRTKNGESSAHTTALRAATALCGVLIAAYIVAVWAMTAKPS
jgi:uncharacterized membrane protein